MAREHISQTSRTEDVYSDKPLDNRTREQIGKPETSTNTRPAHRDIVEYAVDGAVIYHILPEE